MIPKYPIKQTLLFLSVAPDFIGFKNIKTFYKTILIHLGN